MPSWKALENDDCAAQETMSETDESIASLAPLGTPGIGCVGAKVWRCSLRDCALSLFSSSRGTRRPTFFAVSSISLPASWSTTRKRGLGLRDLILGQRSQRARQVSHHQCRQRRLAD